MPYIVVSYSLTGNNRRLAQRVAAEMHATHINLTENKQRSIGTSMLDLLLRRIPAVSPLPDSITKAEAVLLVGPVWIGAVATPLRAYMKQLGTMNCAYAYLSISGGADGPNPKIYEELTRWVKRAPDAVIDLHIADLLPAEPKPTKEVTSAYQLTEQDLDQLSKKALQRLQAFAEKVHP